MYLGEKTAEAGATRRGAPASRTPPAGMERVPTAAGREALLEPSPGTQGPARPHLPGSFIRHPGLPHPRAPSRAEKGLRG